MCAVTGDDHGGQAATVRRFYDANTARFRRLGSGGISIHRAVRGPGVTSRAQAFHHVEERLLRLLADEEAPRVVDLGCGVGGSLLHMATRRPGLRGEGVTISPAQVASARALVERAGLSGRVRVREADYLAPPGDLAGSDLAFSIEAFVHGPDPAAWFRAAAGLVRPGGLVAVCDDVLTPRGERAGGHEAEWLRTFRAGWRIGSLITPATAIDLAADAGLGLVCDDDLTPFLELGRPRDRAIRLMVAATRRFAPRGDYRASLAGGDALQRCLASGLVEYRLLVFARDGTTP